MSKRTKAIPVAMDVNDVTPVAKPAQAKVRRRKRRRRTSQEALAARTIGVIKKREREFLREVSRILTDALGFPVRVSHVTVHQQGVTPRMNTFSRMSKATLRRQVEEAFAPLNDALPI